MFYSLCMYGYFYLRCTNHNLILFCDNDMSNLNKLNFTALKVSKINYLKRIQDVKLHLTAKSLRATIEVEIDVPIGEVKKAPIVIFI